MITLNMIYKPAAIFYTVRNCVGWSVHIPFYKPEMSAAKSSTRGGLTCPCVNKYIIVLFIYED